jgi:SAM-dependent methyltransferase
VADRVRGADDLRARWVERAGEQRLFHINADRTDWTDEDFLASGEHDVAHEVDPHLGHLSTPAAQATALDVGCGVGRLSRALATRFAHVEGVDISPPMVEEARCFAPPVPANVRFQVCVGDGSLPLPDASIDFAFSFLVFQHLPTAALVQANVDELARVLVPGGVARIQVNGHRRSLRQRLSVGIEASDRVPVLHRKPRVKLDPHSHMGVVFTEVGARRLAEHARLEVLDLTGAGQQHLWLLLRRPADPGRIDP